MRIVVLTGAGVSAESGLATFRDADGLWEGHDPTEVATPKAFEADPVMVQRFYDERRAQLAAAQPNAAHQALARLERVIGEDLLVVTQNVDDLHERAGSSRVLHMHGELNSAWCTACDTRTRWDGTLGDRPACPACGAPALRPDVVWFGEVPYRTEEIEEALGAADRFVAIGTSGAVYPAAGFVQVATVNGARTLELNKERSEVSALFDESRQGQAGELVPAWVDDVLAEVGQPG